MQSSYQDTININVEKVIASKNKTMAKYTPKFVINFFRKLIHEDELNQILQDNNNYSGVEFAKGCLRSLNVSANIKYLNKDSIKQDGRYIFVSNHPLGGLDGLVLISEIGTIFPNIKFVVNDFLLNVQPLEHIFIPVNKLGGMSRDYAKQIDNLYKSDNQILYFPAGLCSRLINGKITDLKWQTSFYKKAVLSNREIVPIFFGGSNSMFFYRFAKLRKKLGIKFNLDMMLLPNEMFKKRGAKFNVIIGEPIKAQKCDNVSDLNKACESIREYVYAIAER